MAHLLNISEETKVKSSHRAEEDSSHEDRQETLSGGGRRLKIEDKGRVPKETRQIIYFWWIIGGVLKGG